LSRPWVTTAPHRSQSATRYGPMSLSLRALFQ